VVAQDPRSDEELMEAYRSRGDRVAFEILFQRFGPRLHGYFLRSTGSPEVAGDLVQQTFLHLHRARGDFRAGAPLRPWLFTIAANLRRQHFRRRARKPETSWDAEVHGEPSTGPSVSTPTDRAVRRALSQLGPGQRDVLLLHWYEDLSFAEVAAALGISTSAAKVRAHRAYKQLREILGAQ